MSVVAPQWRDCEVGGARVVDGLVPRDVVLEVDARVLLAKHQLARNERTCFNDRHLTTFSDVDYPDEAVYSCF